MKSAIRKLNKTLFRRKKIKNDTAMVSAEYDAIIHVGAPKTGSSAIQNFLLESRKRLQELNIYYPLHEKDENSVSGGHYRLGISLRDKEFENAKNKYTEYLEVAQKNNSVLLLSTESLYSHPKDLSNITGTERVKIIIFSRDPVETIVSLYNQGVKRHFQTQKIQEYCEKFLRNRNSGWDKHLEEWQTIYDEKDVRIVQYRKSDFFKIPIQEVFLKSIGLSDQVVEDLKPKEIKIINKSYGKAELELKRVLNHILDKENHRMNNQIDRFFQKSSDMKNEPESSIEVTKRILEALRQKFSSDEPLIYRLDYDSRDVQREITILMDILEKDQVDIYDYIQDRFEYYIHTHKQIPFDVYNLGILLRHTFGSAACTNKWFTQQQLDNMLNEKYARADFLRDVAMVFVEKGDLKNADLYISKALAIRPKGAWIKKIKEKIERLREVH